MKMTTYVAKNAFAILMLLSAAIVFNACQKKDTPAEVLPKKEAVQKCSCENEIAFPNIKGESVTLYDKKNRAQMTFFKKGNKYVFGGDMVFTEEQVNILRRNIENAEEPKPLLEKPVSKPIPANYKLLDVKKFTKPVNTNRTGIALATRHWTNRIVPYTINGSVWDQWRILDAIAHWENETNITFVLRTTQANYIEFVNTENACWSYIGMLGGRQEVNIGDDCSTGNAIHEIGHALGLYHEQNRADRNDFVIVNTNNIIPAALHNFVTWNNMPGNGPGFEIGTYDFGSIMTYGSFAFSSNTLPTITRLNGTTFVGQRNALSQGDIDTYNSIYNPIFARIELENIFTYGSWDSYQTYADIYMRFYTDASFTTPTIPPSFTKLWYQYWPLGDPSFFYGFVYVTANNYFFGNIMIEEYYNDGMGGGYNNNSRYEMQPQRVGYRIGETVYHY